MKTLLRISIAFSLALLCVNSAHAGNGAEPVSNPDAICVATPTKRGCPVFQMSNGKPMEFDTKAEAIAYMNSHPIKNGSGKSWLWKKSSTNHWIQRWQ